MSGKLVKNDHGNSKNHTEHAYEAHDHKAHVISGGKHAKITEKQAPKRRDDIHQRRGVR